MGLTENQTAYAVADCGQVFVGRIVAAAPHPEVSSWEVGPLEGRVCFEVDGIAAEIDQFRVFGSMTEAHAHALIAPEVKRLLDATWADAFFQQHHAHLEDVDAHLAAGIAVALNLHIEDGRMDYVGARARKYCNDQWAGIIAPEGGIDE